MIRFDTLEEAGLSVAAVSDKSDGDCSWAGTGRQTLCAHCGVKPEDIVCGRQVHSPTVACVTEADRGRGAPDKATALAATDGIVTSVPGLPLAVQVADCVPVFLYDPVCKAGGVIHAGREGTLQNISGAGVRALAREYNSKAYDLYAAVGPSAGPCCYEVSSEMARAFADSGLPTHGRNLDLWEANAQQLTASGVPREQITVAALCTICGGRFFSYRASGSQERNMALFML